MILYSTTSIKRVNVTAPSTKKGAQSDHGRWSHHGGSGPHCGRPGGRRLLRLPQFGRSKALVHLLGQLGRMVIPQRARGLRAPVRTHTPARLARERLARERGERSADVWMEFAWGVLRKAAWPPVEEV